MKNIVLVQVVAVSDPKQPLDARGINAIYQGYYNLMELTSKCLREAPELAQKPPNPAVKKEAP